MVCPFCGKGPIEPDARVCDRCGKDISNFWRTLKFLENQSSSLRKPVQQMPLDETGTGKIREKSKLAEAIPRAELEAGESDTQNLTKDRDNLRERVRGLEAQLVNSVPRTRLEAEQSETKNLRTELSKLRDDKTQLEAKIEKLTDLTKALQSTPVEIRGSLFRDFLPDLSKIPDYSKTQTAPPKTTQSKPVTPIPQQQPEMGRPHVRRYFGTRLHKGVERKCEACGYNKHRVDAIFCSSCGASLSTGPS